MKNLSSTRCSRNKKKKEFRRKKPVSSRKYQPFKRYKHFRTKQLNTSFKQNKFMIDVKAVKDDEVRLKRCDEKYSQLDLMHRFILQKLEKMEKLVEREADQHAAEQ